MDEPYNFVPDIEQIEEVSWSLVKGKIAITKYWFSFVMISVFILSAIFFLGMVIAVIVYLCDKIVYAYVMS